MTASRSVPTNRTCLRRLAAGVGLLLAAFALVAPEGASAAGAESCREGRSLLPDLAADGRLATIRAAAAAVPHGETKFFRIEHDGVPPSYLFGTVHLSDPRILALPKPVEAAIAASRRVVIETLDVLDGQKATFAVLARPDLTNLPPGRTLADYLTADQRRDLEAALARNGTPFGAIATLQPWFTAMGMLLPPCEAAREAEGAKPLDVKLALDARRAGKEIVGLESAMEQLATLASMSMDLQVANLLATVAIRDRIPDLFETMIDLYVQSRIAEITPLSDALMPVTGDDDRLRHDYDAFENRIVTVRNHRMAGRLQPYLRDGGAFVAVGALHLPGDEGLAELLAKDGYRLVPLG